MSMKATRQGQPLPLTGGIQSNYAGRTAETPVSQRYQSHEYDQESHAIALLRNTACIRFRDENAFIVELEPIYCRD